MTKNNQPFNDELILEMTVSHNEVTEHYSVISQPSKIKVGLRNKLSLWNEIKDINPGILVHWAQQVWNLNWPNTHGVVIDARAIISTPLQDQL